VDSAACSGTWIQIVLFYKMFELTEFKLIILIINSKWFYLVQWLAPARGFSGLFWLVDSVSCSSPWIQWIVRPVDSVDCPTRGFSGLPDPLNQWIVPARGISGLFRPVESVDCSGPWIQWLVRPVESVACPARGFSGLFWLVDSVDCSGSRIQ
jgi:hypothetical protein